MADYGSRKFLVSMFILLSTVGLAVIGKLTAEVASVFSVVVISYHAANAWTTGKGAEG